MTLPLDLHEALYGGKYVKLFNYDLTDIWEFERINLVKFCDG